MIWYRNPAVHAMTEMSQKIFLLKFGDEIMRGIPWAVHSRSQDRKIHRKDSMSESPSTMGPSGLEPERFYDSLSIDR